MLSTLILMATLATTDCERVDAQRIQHHLLETWSDLSANPPSGVSEERLAARRRNLDVLHRYALRGVFPVNPDFEERTPYFIDERGTRCAMAHLIETAGGAEFVARVHRERNNAYVGELIDEPDLHAWLEANGLTVAEAARIQPTYTRCEPWRTLPVCNFAPSTAVPLEATITEVSDAGVFATVDVVHASGSAVSVGQQLKLGDAEHFEGYLDVYAPGTRVYTRHVPGGVAYHPSPIDAQGRIWYALDRKCASRPSVDVASAVLMSADAGQEQCVAALIERDPAYAQAFCMRVPTWDVLPDFCNDDGGVNEKLLPPDAGPPDAGEPMLEPDAGPLPASDGGYEDADAGHEVSDAGALPVANPDDAGVAWIVPEPTDQVILPQGGCSAAPGAWLLALVAGASLTLHRRRNY